MRISTFQLDQASQVILLDLSQGRRKLDCFDDSKSNLENQSTIRSKERSEVAFKTVPIVVPVIYDFKSVNIRTN